MSYSTLRDMMMIVWRIRKRKKPLKRAITKIKTPKTKTYFKKLSRAKSPIPPCSKGLKMEKLSTT